ncbi:hypothetical protein [Streptosporangium roseum]|uniref:hypothetical protein n=1 Tax=Streptosporangium roseum TaxID=2001 RepID=UPI00333311DD
MKPATRLTLLAALCHVRRTEIADSLVDLFIRLVLKINTRAERTLKALAAASAADELRYKARVRTVLRSTYSKHWRQMFKPLLKALEQRVRDRLPLLGGQPGDERHQVAGDRCPTA